MTIAIIDSNANATDALTFDTNAPDARNIMLTSAAAIATQTLDFEAKVGDTAKAWGAAVFNLVFPADDSATVKLDTLIGESKMAAGWATLNVTDAGKKAKSKLESYFSNARCVAEVFETLEEAEQRDIRAGLVSIHYKAGLMRKLAADEVKAAKAEAKRLEAEAAASAPAPVDGDTAPVVASAPRTLAMLIAELHLAMLDASDADLTATAGDVAAMMVDYDTRYNAVIDAHNAAIAA